MEESTPIFDALWEKYNATPIFDQVLREHEHKKYEELVEPYAYPLNGQRMWDSDAFVEMMTANEILTKDEVYELYGLVKQPDMSKLFPDKPDVNVTDEDRSRYVELILNVIAEKRKIKEKKLMTSKWQDLVNEMRHAMDLPVPDAPRQLTSEEAELHINMIRDEFEKEFVPAARSNDLIELYDAGIDVIVYVIGAMSNAGMDIDPGFVEIMRSNMTKMDPVTGKSIRSRGYEIDGEPVGKMLKGPNYDPPKLGQILNDQTRYGHEDSSVYKNLTLPLTLGIGGPKIGEGTLQMDHNGDIVMKGTMMDVSILPILDHLGLSVSGVSLGDDEPKDTDLVRDMSLATIREEDINFNEYHMLREDPPGTQSYVTEFDPPILFDETKREEYLQAQTEFYTDAVETSLENDKTSVDSLAAKIMNDKEQYLKPARQYPDGMNPNG